ncbi:hypothetical protein NDU88_006393 [Pleurodeles waltl]|uniref:Uncharacterized protein n=1 Tax=Pleurodeles waltl TaxID=8319 RepID=A0AAV7QKN5_PLEWA|nr:hypothetical protein NDU88_006393 [Pleurodeles waltl]
MSLGAQRVRNPCSRPSIFPTWGRAAQVSASVFGFPGTGPPIHGAGPPWSHPFSALPFAYAASCLALPRACWVACRPWGRSGSPVRFPPVGAGTPLARLSRPEGGSRFGVARSLGRRRSPTAAGTPAPRIFEVPGVRGPPRHPSSSDCDKQDRLWQWI